MQSLGRRAQVDGTCYFAGGATAVLEGWRESTIDVDIKLVPEHDALLHALPELKSELEINVELAWPGDFVPLPSGWEQRSPSIAREGLLTFRHVDLYAQALAKLERGHAQDLQDVTAMLERGLVDRARLVESMDEIEPELFRFPAVDPPTFRAAVERAVRS
jgi:hypothetical protein